MRLFILINHSFLYSSYRLLLLLSIAKDLKKMHQFTWPQPIAGGQFRTNLNNAKFETERLLREHAGTLNWRCRMLNGTQMLTACWRRARVQHNVTIGYVRNHVGRQCWSNMQNAIRNIRVTTTIHIPLEFVILNRVKKSF